MSLPVVSDLAAAAAVAGQMAAAAVAATASIEALLDPWPVRLAELSPGNRSLVTTRHIEAGELVLRSGTAGTSIRIPLRSRCCAHCLATAAGSMQIMCKVCELAWFCSETCSAQHSERECKLERALASLKLKRDAQFDASWLVSLPEDGSWTSCLGLMRDREGGGAQRRQKLRKQAVTSFLAACEATGEQPGGDAGMLEAVLAARPLNDFGLYDADGELLGRGLFPAAAMANHSCVPNVAVVHEGTNMCMYALAGIELGDHVLQCYVCLDEEDLKEQISSTWRFECRCTRCQGEDLSEFDAKHRCECGGIVLRRNPEGCVCNQAIA